MGTTYETFNKQLAALQNLFTFDSIDYVTVPDLQFEVKAGEKWVFEVNLFTNSIDVSFRVAAVSPAGSTGLMAVINAENATVRGVGINTDTVVSVTPGTDDLIQIKGIVNAGGSGVVQFQLRNNTGTTVQSFRADSWIEATQIS